MSRRSWAMPILSVAFVLLLRAVGVAEPFRYPEGRHGRGELRYVNGIPVLLVQGTPAEMGEQAGMLAFKPLAGVSGLDAKFLQERGYGEAVLSVVTKTGSLMLPQFPPDHLAEMDAIATASGFSRDLLILGNTFPDLRRLSLCSALIVTGSRSATGAPLFGRNLDWRSTISLHEYTLVTVARPTGKRAFASVGFPGLVGCVSGMNDAGLALADLTARGSDGSPPLDLLGVPYTLALRRILEECATVDEAVALYLSLRRASLHSVAICDARRGAVFEVTTRQIIVRDAVDDIAVCTNEFRSPGLAPGTQVSDVRFDLLEQSRQLPRIGLAEIHERLDTVANDTTLQSMIFEPGAHKLHLAFGLGPASQLPLCELGLSTLFKNGEFPPAREPVGSAIPLGPQIAKRSDGGYDVTFRYRPVRRAEAVYLAGAFNAWKPADLKLSGPDADGVYQTTLPLPAGRHEYKFVIDGTTWRHDPGNESVTGEYRNSMLELGE